MVIPVLDSKERHLAHFKCVEIVTTACVGILTFQVLSPLGLFSHLGCVERTAHHS